MQRQIQGAVLVAGAAGYFVEGKRVGRGGEQLDSAVGQAEREEGVRKMTCRDHPAKMTEQDCHQPLSGGAKWK